MGFKHRAMLIHPDRIIKDLHFSVLLFRKSGQGQDTYILRHGIQTSADANPSRSDHQKETSFMCVLISLVRPRPYGKNLPGPRGTGYNKTSQIHHRIHTRIHPRIPPRIHTRFPRKGPNKNIRWEVTKYKNMVIPTVPCPPPLVPHARAPIRISVGR